MPPFQEIIVPKQRLADQAYQQILNAIHDGTIAPSERIVQEKLAEVFRISRTPVREALLRLEQEGILVTADRGGFLIREASKDEIRDIYQTRQAIEGYAAALLTERADKSAFDSVKKTIQVQEGRDHSAAHEYYDANRLIHRSFVAATGNRYLLEMFDLMWNRGFSFHVFRSMTNDNLKRSLQGHMALYEAMRGGNSEQAMAAMRNHISDGLELQLSSLRETPHGS